MYRGHLVSGGRVPEMGLVKKRDRMFCCGGSVRKNQLSSYLFISPKTSNPFNRQRKSQAFPLSFLGRNNRVGECLQKATQVAISQSSSASRSEEHTSELQSRFDLVCRLLLEKKKKY